MIWLEILMWGAVALLFLIVIDAMMHNC